MAVIYGLVDPLDSQHIRYVGMTLDIDGRRRAYQSGNFSGPRVKSWANGLLGLGRRPELIVLDVCSPEKEAEWISDMRARGHKLLNTAPGRKTARFQSDWRILGLDANLALAVQEAAKKEGKHPADVVEAAIRAYLAPKIKIPEVDWGPLDAWRNVSPQAAFQRAIEMTEAIGEEHHAEEVQTIILQMEELEGQPFLLAEDIVVEAVRGGLAPFQARAALDILLASGVVYAKGGVGTIRSIVNPGSVVRAENQNA